MIHPINISFPDEVMASPRKSLMELRKKAKITYLSDGRRLCDGNLVTPKSPNGLWSDVFLRTFARRIGYDLGTSSDSASVDTLIDVIDLEPIQDYDVDHNNSTTQSLRSSNWKEACSSPGIEFDDSPGQFKVSMKSMLSRTNSGVISENRLQPILSPCCSSSPNAEENEKPFKEFLRFDFSHTNIFATELAEPESTKTLILLPNDYGQRICVAKSFDMSSNDSLSDFMKSQLDSQKQTRSQLNFHIESVAISQEYMSLFISITNSRQIKEIQLETEIHAHAASENQIGKCLHKINKTITIFEFKENILSINVGFDQAIKEVFLNKDEYLVLTLHGRVLQC